MAPIVTITQARISNVEWIPMRSTERGSEAAASAAPIVTPVCLMPIMLPRFGVGAATSTPLFVAGEITA